MGNLFTRILACGCACSFLIAVARAAPPQTQEAFTTAASQLELVQSITGVDSRLQPAQYSRVTDEATWHRVWLSHLGVIDGSTISQPPPTIDFSQRTVIVIVEKPRWKTARGLQTQPILCDGNTIRIDYEPLIDPEVTSTPRPKNLFAFLVIPNVHQEIVLRRASKGAIRKTAKNNYLRVATLPSLAASRSPSDAVTLPVRMLNIEFAYDPGTGNYDGVIGSPNDLWNYATLGTTAMDFMRYSDASPSPVRMRISQHDGQWGISGQHGIMRGYIYHNCRCVDLEVTLLGLPAGRYRGYVYAHGDAPNQNAAIELKTGERRVGKKPTANDGTWRFRSSPFIEGVQFVSFDFDVATDEQVQIISHRDGSEYSMFNAIQIVPIEPLVEGNSIESDE